MSVILNSPNVVIGHMSGGTININNSTPAEPAQKHQRVCEDVTPIDTSFFCTDRYSSDIIEKNIRQAINLSTSKADACRRIKSLETYGYITLSNVNDARKAELINPFAAPKYIFTEDDFINARRSKK